MLLVKVIEEIINASGRRLEDIACEAGIEAARIRAAIRRGQELTADELTRLAHALHTTSEKIYERAGLISAPESDSRYSASRLFIKLNSLDAYGLIAVTRCLESELTRIQSVREVYRDQPVFIGGNTQDPPSAIMKTILTGLFMQQVIDDNLVHLYKCGDILMIRAGQEPRIGDLFISMWKKRGYLFLQGPTGPLPLSDAQPNDIILKEGKVLGVVFSAVRLDPDTGLPTSDFALCCQTLNLKSTTSPS